MSWQAINDLSWELWRQRMRWELSPGQIVSCMADGVTGRSHIMLPLEVDLERPWGEQPPACQWGLEMACVDWMARSQRIEPPRLLVHQPLERIERHGFGLKPGFRVLKVKVGPETDLEPLRRSGALLRLDLNGRSAAGLDLPVDYIEDPLEPAHECPYPVALDEPLRGGHIPAPIPNVVAWAVKPAWFGGWGALLRLKAASELAGVRLIISTCWESEIGWRSLVAAAMALHEPGEPAGLDAGPFGPPGPILEMCDVFPDYA